MASWLTQPVQLHSSRAFSCDGFTSEQCNYYQQRWHFWYIAGHVYGLSTIAFFMCAIGISIIGHLISRVVAPQVSQGPSILRRTTAVIRYLSYRGFHVAAFRWNSAPVGLLLLAAVGVIYFFCMDLAPKPYYWASLDYGCSPPLGTRSGWMALACMPFVFATASKASLITLVTGVTHEKLQVFHRWISYAFFILALMHTFPFIVYHIRFHDMILQFTEGNIFYWTGIVALIFQAWLTFASSGAFRNLGYEFFKATHFFSAAVFVLIFFWHCDHTLSSWDYFIATAAVYVPCLVYPWLRTFFEYGINQKARIFVEDNGFIRITIPANFDWVPGQHCFLRFRGFGIHTLTSHPFTICSLPSTSPHEQSHITFYVRHRGGFTTRLYHHAMKRPGVSVPVFVDGPYGGIDPHKYHSSDRLIVIAGGSGAGWSLPFVEQFARCCLAQATKEAGAGEESTSDAGRVRCSPTAPRSLRVILATSDTATRMWFHKSVGDLLSKYPSQNPSFDLDVQVYLTGQAEQQTHLPDVLADLETAETSFAEIANMQKDGAEYEGLGKSSVESQERHGRPPFPDIIQEEAAQVAESGQALGVFVCGPDTMQNDVRNAVAKANLKVLKSPTCGVYLHLEHFSWA
ncbi:Ferric/cupric reductase transmembrane component 7 [Exophiala xenobiotica]|nr:Ferric/cupric reductase transmembrane component 7 [Exophiala xenobiotica]KAK5235226.1 Ferric/cupric reductase transmembrane component 7 [Exophiala xenobiotica]KAK5249613.1 Ferric/cupric reductase transmembrane component 7 [Exophiala xenobiotica]KAK5291255.1 Ferric/cupric reductase transmembrane component 7 [Exophiala xenobiotica]KAK5316530.1 Ferric/cupric reductase transmembrane component 7 [Exophiala xenobiotica]